MTAFIIPLLMGLGVTLRVLLGAALVAAVAGLAAGLMRVARSPWASWAARAYITLFRGTSALVQLFWVYFGLPLLGLEIGPMTAGIMVLGLNTGAYGAEVVRSAIQAVPRQQWEAAQALGLSRRLTMWRIVLPQAFVTMLPPLGNLLIELLKGTALVSLITLSDLTFEARVLRDHTLRTTEIFGVVLVLYFGMAQVLAAAIRVLERRAGAFRGGHGRHPV
jgi:polar amino acid transport system permease protein